VTVRADKDCLSFVAINNVYINSIPHTTKEFTQPLTFTADGSYIISVICFNRTFNFPIVIDTVAPLTVPQNSILISYSDGSVSLSWNAPDSSGEEYTYSIYRSTQANFDVNDVTISEHVDDVTTTSYVDEFAQPGIFYYKIVVIDKAENKSPASEAVSITIAGPNYTLVFVGVGAAAVVGIIAMSKLKSKKGKTLLEKGVKQTAAGKSNKVVSSKAQTAWDEATSSAEASTNAAKKKAEDDLVWKDISADAWTAKTNAPVKSTSASASSSATNATSATSAMSTPNKASMSASRGMSGTSADPTSRFDNEMAQAYKNAQEFADLGQESMAVQSYQMLLRLAEKKSDSEMITFIKKKMDDLYK
jgi:hypothetical protein